MKIVQTDQLQPGMILASPIYSSDGRLLFERNVVMEESSVRRLNHLPAENVYVYDRLSENINVEKVFKTKTIANTYAACEKQNFDSCMLVASMIVDDMISHIDALPNMEALQSYDSDTFLHCINVGVLSGLVGIELDLEKEQLVHLVASGLLHDIGKSDIPPDIIKKKSWLTEKEMTVVKEHPRLGYNRVESSAAVPSVVKDAILYHHENFDGSGYPDGKSGDEIPLFARIIHICDVYDAMISERCYKDAINPANVINYLLAESGKMFDPEYLTVFEKCIFPYTTGSVVMLSNGEVGVVKENYKGLPGRPDIKVLSTGEVICLRERTDLMVKSIETNLPDQHSGCCVGF